MKFRTFLILLVAFVAISALAVALLDNLPLLEQRFQLTAERSLPVYGIIILAFILGLSLTVLISILQDSRRAFEQLKRWWGSRTRRANEERYRRGIEALLGGDHERALASFSDVLAHQPDHFDALMVSGDALRNLQRFEQAIERHRRARRLRPQDLRPLYSLASDYEDSDQRAKARLALSKIVEQEPKKSVSALRRLRQLQMKDGDWEGALAYQERIEALTEKRPYKIEAEKRYGVGLRYQIAVDQIRRNEIREAIASLHKVLKAAPDFAPAILRLGEAQKQEGDLDGAVDTWRQGFETTSSPIFLTALENHFLEMEEPQVAIDTFRSMIAGSSLDVLPRFFLGKLYLRLEMIDDAYREFSNLQRRVTQSPALHCYLGQTLARRSDFERASEEFHHALEQVDLLRLQYACTVCSTKSPSWVDRCDNCGEWNTITLDFREDRTVEELGISPTPVYSA